MTHRAHIDNDNRAEDRLRLPHDQAVQADPKGSPGPLGGFFVTLRQAGCTMLGRGPQGRLKRISYWSEESRGETPTRKEVFFFFFFAVMITMMMTVLLFLNYYW